MKRKTVYIAGPMSGYELLNFPAFDEAAKRFRKAGWNVINPAELDRVNGIHEYTPIGEHGGYKEVMARDTAAICICDAIALLPGWEKSPGTGVELALAKLLDLSIYDAMTMKKMKLSD